MKRALWLLGHVACSGATAAPGPCDSSADADVDAVVEATDVQTVADVVGALSNVVAEAQAEAEPSCGDPCVRQRCGSGVVDDCGNFLICACRGPESTCLPCAPAAGCVITATCMLDVQHCGEIPDGCGGVLECAFIPCPNGTHCAGPGPTSYASVCIPN